MTILTNKPKHNVLWLNKTKTRPFLHIILAIKDSLQQQIRFNGNIFENKSCHCNESSLYSYGYCGFIIDVRAAFVSDVCTGQRGAYHFQ